MTRSAFLCLLAVALTACQSAAKKGSPSKALPGLTDSTKQRLANNGIPHCIRVAAFATNRGGKFPAPNQTLQVNGRLNPNRVPLHGRDLDDSQVNAFLDATTLWDHPSLSARCFYPHHAIAFYGVNGRILADYDICFSCLGFRTSDSNAKFVDEPDYHALRRLFKGLKLLKTAP